MLAPKRVKFRKWQKGRLRGPALRGATIAFGDIGLKTVEHGKLTNQQIEAARIAMMRHIKRGGKVWIRVFPDHPVTAKPLETRQGSGKGAPVGHPIYSLVYSLVAFKLYKHTEQHCKKTFSDELTNDKKIIRRFHFRNPTYKK